MPATIIAMLPYADIMLRVPCVFLMDTLLHSPDPFQVADPVPAVDDVARGQEGSDREFTEFNDWNLSQLAFISLRCFGFLAAFIMFTLFTKTLVDVYRWLISLLVIGMSFGMNYIFTAGHEPSWDRLADFSINLFLQFWFALIFVYTCVGPRSHATHYCTGAAFLVPSLAILWPVEALLPAGASLAIIAAIVGLAYVMCGLVTNLKVFYRAAGRTVWLLRSVAQSHGLHVLLEDEWVRLKVPRVLRLFWLVRFSEHAVFQIVGTEASASLTLDNLAAGIKELLVQGCDTIVAVLGMTSVVSTGAHYLSCAIQQFLVADDDDEKSFGTVSAILFFILALQTGLTGLEPEKRFTRLYRNFCLLSTAILHFIHNMVNPLLMSLSASRSRSVSHHARALSVCAFLVAFPCWFLTYLWRTHHVSTWLLAVSAFSIEVTIKVVISLLIYALFMIDAYRNAFWERLDDYVYYVRATGNTIEFVFGIFLFFNGAWILLFEAGGTIRACMMGIHAYFNIWMQAKAGWKVFMRRRTAVNQINTFREATAEQLRELNDVCAICYQEMGSARITRCNHFFHKLCLRKWLYIQDRCPMCHKTLYEIEPEEVGADGGDPAMPQPDDTPEVQPHNDGSQQRNVLNHEHQD